jgi:hypothetical protein
MDGFYSICPTASNIRKERGGAGGVRTNFLGKTLQILYESAVNAVGQCLLFTTMKQMTLNQTFVKKPNSSTALVDIEWAIYRTVNS